MAGYKDIRYTIQTRKFMVFVHMIAKCKECAWHWHKRSIKWLGGGKGVRGHLELGQKGLCNVQKILI